MCTCTLLNFDPCTAATTAAGLKDTAYEATARLRDTTKDTAYQATARLRDTTAPLVSRAQETLQPLVEQVQELPRSHKDAVAAPNVTDRCVRIVRVRVQGVYVRVCMCARAGCALGVGKATLQPLLEHAHQLVLSAAATKMIGAAAPIMTDRCTRAPHCEVL